MSSLTVCLRVAAMGCGAALIASQVLQNLEHLGWAHAHSGLGLAAIAVPISMAIAVPVMQHCWNGRQIGSAAVALVVLLCGLSHTTIVALERGAHVRDTQAAAKSNYRHELAAKDLEDARSHLRGLEADLVQERRTGCGSSCRSLQASISEARARVAEAQSALAQLGAPVDENSMAKRYGTAALIIDIVHPLALPLAVELGALVLIGFAFHREKATPTSQTVAAPAQPSKVDEAAVVIRQLREASGGQLGSVRDVAAQIGHSPTTTYRAMQRAAS